MTKLFLPNIRLRLIAIVSSLIFLASCQSLEGHKQTVGAVSGAALGALLGNQIGHGKGRRIATVAGALLGLYVGQKIGAGLDERDQLALQQRAAEALEQQQATNTHWQSENNENVSAEIAVTETSTQVKQHEIVKIKEVEKAPEMQLIGKTYVSNASANVRFGPSTNYDKSASLAPNEAFTAVGKTDNNWIMVAKNNITVGYVSADLVSEPKVVQASTSTSTSTSTPTQPQPQQQSKTPVQMRDKEENNAAIDLDQIAIDAEEAGINLDEVELETEIVSAETECKNMDIEVDNQGKKSKQNFQACKAADGAWEII